MAKININGFAVTPEEAENVKGLATSLISRPYNNDLEFWFKINKTYVVISALGDGNYWVSFPYVDDNKKLFRQLTTVLWWIKDE